MAAESYVFNISTIGRVDLLISLVQEMENLTRQDLSM